MRWGYHVFYRWTGPAGLRVDLGVGPLSGADSANVAWRQQPGARYLRYRHALTAGWPIAPGIIEAACRSGRGEQSSHRGRTVPRRCLEPNGFVEGVDGDVTSAAQFLLAPSRSPGATAAPIVMISSATLSARGCRADARTECVVLTRQ
jgi:hypothetical protein